MLKDQDLIKSQTDDLLFGGLQQSIEWMFTLDIKFSLIWLEFSCTEKFQRSKFLWFKFSEHIFGRKFMKTLWWIFAQYLIKSRIL